MAEYCDFAECTVQNSPKELERLHSRDEITTEEYKLLLELSTGKTTSAADLPEAHLEGSEVIKGVYMGSGASSTRNTHEKSEEKTASTNSEAFRWRAERMKRYHVPPTRLDIEDTLKP